MATEHQSVLQVDNLYGRLVSTDRELIETLHEKLRFRPPNFWHSVAYKKKKWDGWKEFFDLKNGKFLTGLMPEITAALKFLKKPYTLIDNRNPVQWMHTSIDDQFLNQCLPDGMSPITLHDYQPDLANQCFKYNRGIVQAPTGAGKTFILVSILKSLPPKTPVLFLTKNASLVHQNWEEMKKWNVEGLGRWYDKYKEPNYVICATVHKQTLESLDKLLPKFKVLVVDEVHDCMSDVPLKAYKRMTNAAIRIGFSATPFKWHDKKIDNVHKYSVKGHFGPVFKTTTTESGLLTTKDLQERDILSHSNCFVYPIRHPDLTHEPYADAVTLGVEQNFHFHEIVKNLVATCPGRTLIVVERIEQGHYLEKMIPGATFIQGSDSLKDRVPVLNALKEGDRSVAIVMRQIITAGINVRIHDLINAAGGKGAHNVIQLMGRGLRPANDKEKLRYHDFLFHNNDYLKDHSEWRVEVLRKEGHDVTVLDTINF
jgi:superfamily II DNA or RNA helicase